MKRLIPLLLFSMGAFAQSITQLDAFISGTNRPGGPFITAGSPLASNGFTLQVTGTNFGFDFVVDWIDNNNPNNTVTLSPTQQPTATQITVTVTPPNLYATPTTVFIQVRPTDAPRNGIYAHSTFVVNPQITALTLPPGILNSPYNQALSNGGTQPYLISLAGGATPPGMLTYNPPVSQRNTLYPGTPTALGTFNFSFNIVDAWGVSATNAYILQVINGLAITSPPLPSGTVGASYAAYLTAANGMPPYFWSARGLPPGLVLNSQTGAITGTPTTAGSFPVTVTVGDNAENSVSAPYNIAIGQPVILPPPLTITTPSTLPSGMVGTSYVVLLDARGGTPGYAWSLIAGRLPAGLLFSSSGFISGTPTAAGQSTFSVQVTDSNGQTAAGDFSLTVQPPPLAITTTSPLPGAAIGTPLTIKFAATGGIPPYRFGVTGSLPPGTSLASDGTLSGTPVAPGAFAFRIAVTDSSIVNAGVASGAVVTKDFTIAITPPLLTISTASPLAAGQAGVSYSVQFAATGGGPPYTWSGSGVPAGLSLSGSGLLSGTPTVNGPFTISVTVTDSAGAKATGNFAVTILLAPLAITTTSLPNGAVGAAYSAGLIAAGGVPPYSWSVTGLPDGLSATAAGAIAGTPTSPGKFNVSVTVKDSASSTAAATATQQFNLTISPPPLTITTASLPGATAGSAYSATFTASGGVPPYAWSATGLPAGLNLSPGGTLSGTPTAPGTPSFTVTAKDSAGAAVTKIFQVSIALPPAPPVNFNGLSDTGSPATPQTLTLALGSSYPVDITVNLTLTFVPDSGADDPAVQFSTGGRTARIVIPAGSTTGPGTLGVQTGTVAGNIAVTAQLQTAANTDITPTPAPKRVIRINAGAPVLTAVTATRTSTGFNVAIVGYATDRELTQAVFLFNAAAGSNLQTTQLTVPVDTLFSQWYSSAASNAFGSQFSLTQPFTIQGNTQAVVSVTVTMVNKVGTSAAVTATLQ